MKKLMNLPCCRAALHQLMEVCVTHNLLPRHPRLTPEGRKCFSENQKQHYQSPEIANAIF